MTDRPHGSADTAVGPVPGYYPDPSIPGFVRYWGGTAWVPGTTRPAPVEGEVLEPPRMRSRQAAAPAVPSPVAPAVAVPPVAPSPAQASPAGAPAEAQAAAHPAVTGPSSGPLSGPLSGPSTPYGLSEPQGPDTRTGPLYFDETSGGASFVMAPQGELEVRPRADVEPLRADVEALRPVPPADLRPAELRPAAVPGARPAPGAASPAGPAVAVAGGARTAAPALGSGWQADPQAQRGLLETGAAPRWVSWGVLPAAAEGPGVGVDGRPSTADHPAAPPSFPAPAPVRALQVEVDPGPEPRTVGEPEDGAVPEPGGGFESTAAKAAGPAGGPAAAGLAQGAEGSVVPGQERSGSRAAGAGPGPHRAERAPKVVEVAEAAVEAVVENAPESGASAAVVPRAAVPSSSSSSSSAAAAAPPAGSPVPAPAVPAAPGRPRPAAARQAAGATVPAPGSAPSPKVSRPGAAGAERGKPARSRRSAERERPAPLVSAGLGRRCAARIVDTLVSAVVAAAAGVPLAASAAAHVREKVEQARAASTLAGREVTVWLVDDVVIGKAGVLVGVLVLLGVLYEVLPTARTGRTLGKRLARIRVVDVRRSGGGRRPPSSGRSLWRWAVRQTAVLLLPVALLWVLLDRRSRRGWHDRAAGTRVVKG